jgi:hypothetical protein
VIVAVLSDEYERAAEWKTTVLDVLDRYGRRTSPHAWEVPAEVALAVLIAAHDGSYYGKWSYYAVELSIAAHDRKTPAELLSVVISGRPAGLAELGAGPLVIISLRHRAVLYVATIAKICRAYGTRAAGVRGGGAWELPPALGPAVAALDEVGSHYHAGRAYREGLRVVLELARARAPAEEVAAAALRLREELLPEYAPRALERALEGVGA